jgi:hypothetical protein
MGRGSGPGSGVETTEDAARAVNETRLLSEKSAVHVLVFGLKGDRLEALSYLGGGRYHGMPHATRFLAA